MILVCPSCDAKFKVPDNAIPPEGRKVRCANCGHAWHATTADELKAPAKSASTAKPAAPRATVPSPATAGGPENFQPPVTDMDAGAAAQAAALRRSVVEEVVPETAPAGEDDDLFDEGLGTPDTGSADEMPAEETDFDEAEAEEFAEMADGEDGEDFDEDEDFGDFDEDDILARRRGDLRREAERKIQALKQKLLAAGWIALLIFIIGVLFSLFFMKDTVTAMYPGTNQLYDFFADAREESIYQPDTEEPLTPPITETEVYVSAGLFEDQLRFETVDGQSYLIIPGQLTNTGTRAASVPKVELTILDNLRRVLDQWVFDPPGLVLRRQSTLRFEARRVAPAGAASVEVRPLEGTQSDNRAPQI